MDYSFEQEAKIYEDFPDELLADDLEEDDDYYTTNSLALYLQEIERYPLLTPTEEQELAKEIAKGNKKAKKQFINSNLRLVVSIAKNYRYTKLDLLDLIQEGNIGLITAIKKFDYAKGFKFSTYATPWIKESILRALAKKGEAIRIPENIQSLISKYQAIQNSFYKNTGKYATDSEISEEMQISVYELKNIKSYIYNIISFNTPISCDDDVELGDYIKDKKGTPEEVFLKKSDKESLDFLISNSNLKEIELTVIRLRYCSNNFNSLDSIAKKLGKTRDCVRIIEAKALRKLRFAARRNLLKDFYM